MAGPRSLYHAITLRTLALLLIITASSPGLALLRYALLAEVSVYEEYVALGLDGVFFSDRQADNQRARYHPRVLTPTSCTSPTIATCPSAEAAWCNTLYLLASVGFDIVKPSEEPPQAARAASCRR
jgi:hypothetical protein